MPEHKQHYDMVPAPAPTTSLSYRITGINDRGKSALKGTVQQNLTCVKSCINRQLMVSSCSHGHFFKFKGPLFSAL
jgi:hypothetical protein